MPAKCSRPFRTSEVQLCRYNPTLTKRINYTVTSEMDSNWRYVVYNHIIVIAMEIVVSSISLTVLPFS